MRIRRRANPDDIIAGARARSMRMCRVIDDGCDDDARTEREQQHQSGYRTLSSDKSPHGRIVCMQYT